MRNPLDITYEKSTASAEQAIKDVLAAGEIATALLNDPQQRENGKGAARTHYETWLSLWTQDVKEEDAKRLRMLAGISD